MTQTAEINTLENNKRVSTQDLLQWIYKKVDEGISEFDITASGQHNIGGSMWRKDGGDLVFRVKNPGQRVGSMGMPGTKIFVEGSAPADVGWLNSGAEIVVKGDTGDTTSHCAASGKIFVSGRSGTRSGALMKHDPKYPDPELWVLKNTGSFSFEFMGGGTAVVCGYECEDFSSVLGDRACMGMVGGTVYVRGCISGISEDVWVMDLDEKDREFLKKGLEDFLSRIEKADLYSVLSNFSSWKKIVAKTNEERNKKTSISLKDFRLNKWVENGIFGDLIEDDFEVGELVPRYKTRLKIPKWKNYAYDAPCAYNCPIGIPTQERFSLLRKGLHKEAYELILKYSPLPASVCAQVCPNLCMDVCSRAAVDDPLEIGLLGGMSAKVQLNLPPADKKEKIAVIGSGVAGITAAWHLVMLGYGVELFEEDSEIGGKLRQVIPNERLSRDVLKIEMDRFKNSGVKINANTKVNAELFDKLQKDFDAVVVAIGAHSPVVIPFEGHEKLIRGLEFLKAVNRGEKPETGKKVVVIGAGNAAMDVVIEAYKLGAEKVTAIDIQKPSAFEKEIRHAESLGAEILFPAFTQIVTDKGVELKDGTFIEADSVIISVGDRPVLDFLDKKYLNERSQAVVDEYLRSVENSKVFIIGDAHRCSLFTNAMGDGRNTALNIDKMFRGEKLISQKEKDLISSEKLKFTYYQRFETDNNTEQNRCMSCGYCRDCAYCRDTCPNGAIERIQKEDGTHEYVSHDEKCIGCGICAGICPCGVWTMVSN